jgi:tetratricopeptide (TPR) repeat protein
LALDRTLPGLSAQARAEIDKYLAAYAKDPRSRAFAALAEAYRRAGMLDEAIKVAEEGLQNHPQLQSALTTLGRAYFQKGELEKARPLLERVIAQSPDNLAAQRALGELYFQLGESQLARTALQAVLRASPADPEAQLRLQQLAPPPAPLGAQAPSPAEAPVPPPAPPAPLGAQVPPPAEAQVPSPAQSSAAPLSEPKKMDLFFESVDVSHSAPPPPRLDYQVRSATEIFSDLEEEKRRSPITTETLARLLLKQGYADKARVIFEGIFTANPSRQDLLPEINRLRQQAGLTPFEPPPAPTPPALGAQVVPTPALGPRVPPAPTLGAQVPPTPALGARVPPPARSPASPAAPPKPAPPKPTVWDIPEPAPASTVPVAARVPPTPALGARVPPAPTLGARVPPPAQKAPQPAIASPPAKPGPPTKAEKVEALKEILERIKKGNKP